MLQPSDYPVEIVDFFSARYPRFFWLLRRCGSLCQGYTKIMMNVLIAGVRVDQRKSDWIFFVFVYPRLKTRYD